MSPTSRDLKTHTLNHSHSIDSRSNDAKSASIKPLEEKVSDSMLNDTMTK